MAKAISTSADIHVPRGRVWVVHEPFSAYPEWNPFVSRVEGLPLVGDRPVVRLTPPGGRAMTFRPCV